MKKVKEWFVDVPWGKLALVSWGSPEGEPVLLVHGREDSAATFIPLLEHLPDSLHYVGVDLPGHGWSDPMPIGVTLTRLHLLSGVEYAVKHLQWDNFTYIGHSLGCELGLFFNAIYPGKIKQFMLIDPILSAQRLHIEDFSKYYRMFYENYYDNYHKYNCDDRVYSKRRIVEAVMKARGLSEELAEIVLSRNLWPIGDDKYRLSWDRRLKFPATTNFTPQYYYEIFSISTPPTLVISAMKTDATERPREVAEDLVERLRRTSKEFYVQVVEGPHDVHLTNSAVVAEKMIGFMNRLKKSNSKL